MWSCVLLGRSRFLWSQRPRSTLWATSWPPCWLLLRSSGGSEQSLFLTTSFAEHPRWLVSSSSPSSLQALCVELLPSGERAPEQLRWVSCGPGYLCGAAQRWRPDAAGTDDGPGGRSPEPLGQEDLEEVPQPVAPTPPAVHLTVRNHVCARHRALLFHFEDECRAGITVDERSYTSIKHQIWKDYTFLVVAPGDYKTVTLNIFSLIKCVQRYYTHLKLKKTVVPSVEEVSRCCIRGCTAEVPYVEQSRKPRIWT